MDRCIVQVLHLFCLLIILGQSLCKAPQRCPRHSLRRGRVIGTERGIGKILRYKCFRGLTLYGPRARICQVNGKWSGARPLCTKANKKFCPDPGFVYNGILTVTKRRYTVGAIIRFSCNKGYKLVGPPAIACSWGHKWSGPVSYCEPDGCQDPGNPANGKRLGSRFKKDYTVRFMCNPGFTLYGRKLLTCLKNGMWNYPTPQCLSKDESLKRKAVDFSKNFKERLKVLTIDGRGRSRLLQTAQGLDLVFLLDYSESVGKRNFKKAVDFTKSIISDFGLSDNSEGTHVAVIVFGSTAELQFNLMSTKVWEKDIALEELENIKFSGGGTATRAALDIVLQRVANETRKNAKKVIFIITDGKANVGGDPASSAAALRHKLGFEIFAVGISSDVNRKELESLASIPFDRHVFLLDNFQMLDNLKKIINRTQLDYSSCGLSGDTQSREVNYEVIKAKHGAWPWTVLIEHNWIYTCMGALIAPRWVITAASCLQSVKGSTRLSVVTGFESRTKFTGSEQRIVATQVIIHKSYRNVSVGLDLGLIKLAQPIKGSAYTRPICLPEGIDTLLIRPQKVAYTAGFNENDMRTTLHQAAVPLIDFYTCTAKTKNVARDKLCAGNDIEGQSSCVGVIGSPLMVQKMKNYAGNRKRYHWILVGILSKTGGCSREQPYALFADVYRARHWLKKKIS